MTRPTIELYFPASFLIVYTGRKDISDLRNLSKTDALKLYRTFNTFSDLDERTSINLPTSLRKRFIQIRNKIRKKSLGVDIVLCFSIKRDKTIPTITPETLEEYSLPELEQATEDVKIRFARIAERILTTDLVFRFYDAAYDEIKDIVKAISKLDKKLANLPPSEIFVDTLYERFIQHRSTIALSVWVPDMLPAFLNSAFPTMSFTQAIAFGLLHFFASKRYIDFEFDDVEDSFVEACENDFRKALDLYKESLINYKKSLESYLESKNYLTPSLYNQIEEEIKKSLPIKADALDLYYKIVEIAKDILVDTDYVAKVFGNMLKSNKIVKRGDFYHVNK